MPYLDPDLRHRPEPPPDAAYYSGFPYGDGRVGSSWFHLLLDCMGLALQRMLSQSVSSREIAPKLSLHSRQKSSEISMRGVPFVMPVIAREFNLSETVFVTPVEGKPLHRRLRILGAGP